MVQRLREWWVRYRVLMVGWMLGIAYGAYELRTIRDMSLRPVLLSYADRVERLFQQSVDNMIYQLGYIGKVIASSNGQLDSVHALLESMALGSEEGGTNPGMTNFILGSFAWLDERGDVVAYDPIMREYHGGLLWSRSLYDRLAQLAPFRGHVFEPIHSANDGMALPLAITILGLEHQLLGAVVGLLPLSPLQTRIDNSLLAPGVDFMLFDEDGRIFLQTRKHLYFSYDHALMERLKAMLRRMMEGASPKNVEFFEWNGRMLVLKLMVVGSRYGLVVTKSSL